MNRILINVIIMITFSFSTFSCAKKPRPVKITRINILESGIYTMTEKDSNFYVNNSNEQKVFELEVKEVTNWKIVKKTDIVPRTQSLKTYLLKSLWFIQKIYKKVFLNSMLLARNILLV
jgi:hypothetical protein